MSAIRAPWTVDRWGRHRGHHSPVAPDGREPTDDELTELARVKAEIDREKAEEFARGLPKSARRKEYRAYGFGERDISLNDPVGALDAIIRQAKAAQRRLAGATFTHPDPDTAKETPVIATAAPANGTPGAAKGACPDCQRPYGARARCYHCRPAHPAPPAADGAAAPCADCGTTGGYIAPGATRPRRTFGRCQKCHSEHKRASAATAPIADPAPPRAPTLVVQAAPPPRRRSTPSYSRSPAPRRPSTPSTRPRGCGPCRFCWPTTARVTCDLVCGVCRRKRTVVAY